MFDREKGLLFEKLFLYANFPEHGFFSEGKIEVTKNFLGQTKLMGSKPEIVVLYFCTFDFGGKEKRGYFLCDDVFLDGPYYGVYVAFYQYVPVRRLPHTSQRRRKGRRHEVTKNFSDTLAMLLL
jgi:hypothetical protein